MGMGRSGAHPHADGTAPRLGAVAEHGASNGTISLQSSQRHSTASNALEQGLCGKPYFKSNSHFKYMEIEGLVTPRVFPPQESKQQHPASPAHVVFNRLLGIKLPPMAQLGGRCR